MKLPTFCGGALLLAALVTVPALAGTPDPVNSTATAPGGTVLCCPAGDGTTLASRGTPVSIQLLDGLGNPCVGYSASWIWLEDLGGNVLECGAGPGTHPLHDTDVNGITQIDGALGTGGWTQAGLQVTVGPSGGQVPLAGPALSIQLNSPDITGDGLVDLADINLFGFDLGGYVFRSDFNTDGLVNAMDLAAMAAHSCHSCNYFVPLSAVLAEGSVGIYFDNDGAPYTEHVKNAALGAPFLFSVVAEGIDGMTAIDVPLRYSSGLIVSVTPVAGTGIDPILYGSTCFDASAQTVIAQGQAFAIAPGPQTISFGSPYTACNGMPAAAYVPCAGSPKAPQLGGGFRKVLVSSRGIVNGILNLADPAQSTVDTPADCCIMACPAGDGDTFTDVACLLTVTAVDGTGSPVIGLNGSDFEVDGIVSSDLADCQHQTPGFTESPPGTYTFTHRVSAGGQSQSGLQVRVQGVTPVATGGGTITVVSPDINGDGIVNLIDVGEFAWDINDTPPTDDDWRSDFDCSGQDVPLDVGRLALHFHHGGCVLDPVDKVSPAKGSIYVSVQADRRVRELEIAPGATFRFHVLAEGTEDLTAWEARVVVPKEILVTRRTLAGEHAVTLGPGTDEWIVGLGERRSVETASVLLLATYEAVLTRPLSADAEITIAGLARGRASVSGERPAWVEGRADQAQMFAFDTAGSSMRLRQAAVVEDPSLTASARTQLLGAAPNPFNPATTIRFEMGHFGNAVIGIFDLAGRRIRTEVLQDLAAGPHEFSWNGRDDHGVSVASGTYAVRLQTADGVDVHRVALLK